MTDVFGDPAGMRALAAVLRHAADRTAHSAEAAARRAAAVPFQGPYADRFRHEVIAWRNDVGSAPDRLRAVAEDLERGAASVEAARLEAARQKALQRR